MHKSDVIQAILVPDINMTFQLVSKKSESEVTSEKTKYFLKQKATDLVSETHLFTYVHFILLTAHV